MSVGHGISFDNLALTGHGIDLYLETELFRQFLGVFRSQQDDNVQVQRFREACRCFEALVGDVSFQGQRELSLAWADSP